MSVSKFDWAFGVQTAAHHASIWDSRLIIPPMKSASASAGNRLVARCVRGHVLATAAHAALRATKAAFNPRQREPGLRYGPLRSEHSQARASEGRKTRYREGCYHKDFDPTMYSQ